jgi:hypothetical protein
MRLSSTEQFNQELADLKSQLKGLVEREQGHIDRIQALEDKVTELEKGDKKPIEVKKNERKERKKK